jgi:hypothetical protein
MLLGIEVIAAGLIDANTFNKRPIERAIQRGEPLGLDNQIFLTDSISITNV